MTIKSPVFDQKKEIGATSESKPTNPDTTPIAIGTRVLLFYKGKGMQARVTVVEEESKRFVGRVLGFDGVLSEHGDLREGDLIRLKRSDIRWID